MKGTTNRGATRRAAWASLASALLLPMAATAASYDLSVDRVVIDTGDFRKEGIGFNGASPGPVLRFREGEEVTINVTNNLDEPTSVHWHGFILPYRQDGVPDISYPGIAPGETFTYRFPIVQSGTYWFHSHSGFQEPDGAYGAIVIEPKGVDPVEFDREYVLTLADKHPHDGARVMRNLKLMPDYYNRRQETLFDFFDDVGEQGLGAAVAERTAWGEMRMMRTDVEDVQGFTALINGKGPDQNWTGLFEPGERVRLRFVNASAMTFFDVRIPGARMTVVQADGNDVQSVTVDEFRIAVAETYDVVVHLTEDRAYTLFAESMGRSAFARGTLAPRPGLVGEVPAMREPPLLTMADMGMAHGDHGGMDHAAMGHAMPETAVDHAAMGHAMPEAAVDHAAMGHAMPETAVDHAAMGHAMPETAVDHAAMGHAMPAAAVDHAAMGHAMPETGVDHAAMGHAMPEAAVDHAAMGHAMPEAAVDHAAMGHAMPEAAVDHAAMGHAMPETAVDHAAMGHAMPEAAVDHAAMGHAMPEAETHLASAPMVPERAGQDPFYAPGSGLAPQAADGGRFLSYADLRARRPLYPHRPATREIELRLTGNMERYMWSVNGIKYSDAEPIRLRYGERVRFRFVNETMMAHPMHLHGMWSLLDVGAGEWNPAKHVINVAPGTTVYTETEVDAPGEWAFHCHLSYHAASGMFRKVVVEGGPRQAAGEALPGGTGG